MQKDIYTHKRPLLSKLGIFFQGLLTKIGKCLLSSFFGRKEAVLASYDHKIALRNA